MPKYELQPLNFFVTKLIPQLMCQPYSHGIFAVGNVSMLKNRRTSICTNLALYERRAIYRPYIGHTQAIHKLYISHVQPTVQATDGPYPYLENGGGGRRPPPPHFLHIYYGPYVACTVGCTWLMYSLCMAHILPMYDLYMDYMAVFLYMPSLVYLLVRQFLSMRM